MSQISVVAPVGQAIETTKRILFRPFEIVKWCGMGFTAWLAMLAETFSSGGNLLNHFPSEGSNFAGTAGDWLNAHLVLVIVLAVVLGSVFIALSLLMTWLTSRGKFMFLDNVIRNRGEISEPWRRLKPQGNSFFLFSICLGLAILVVVAVMAAICLAVAYPDISARSFGVNAIVAILLGTVFLFCFSVTAGCIGVFLEDFIVPIMALKTCRILEAWRHFFGILKTHIGVFALYLLFKIVLAVVVSSIAMIVCCALCCVMWLPYVGTVILLPLFVFMRSYSLHFLEQFGPEYAFFDQPSIYLAVERE